MTQPKQDLLHRFLFTDQQIRGELIQLDQCWQHILQRQDYPHAVRQQLGEALALTGLLSATIKFQGSLILQVQGQGPLTTLVVQASDQGQCRGLARWQGEVPEGNLQQTYGQGQVVMTINSERGERYQSIVALQGDNLGQALEHYFRDSEQLQSRFWLFVGAERVAGLMVQELPGGSKDVDAWQRINLLAETASAQEALNLPAEDFLYRLFHEQGLQLFEPKPITFHCGCSRDKIGNTLVAMGRDSLDELLESQPRISVDCEFCGTSYDFDREDVQALFAYQGEAPGVAH